MEQGSSSAALSDRLLDAACLLGHPARCREQIEAFRAAGVDLPILPPRWASSRPARSSGPSLAATARHLLSVKLSILRQGENMPSRNSFFGA